MNQELTGARLTSKQRTALNDLLNSNALQAARQERMQAIADKRKAVRARLKEAAEIEPNLAKKAAEVAAFESKVFKARAELQRLLVQFDLLKVEEQSFTHQRDLIRHRVAYELWDLADPRAHRMRFWLLIMRHEARNAFKTETTMERKMFGVVKNVSTNVDRIQAATAAVDKADLELEQLVMQADVVDYGPALQEIAANVRRAFEPLQRSMDLGRELPELDLA